jgi:hypothetical protein
MLIPTFLLRRAFNVFQRKQQDILGLNLTKNCDSTLNACRPIAPFYIQYMAKKKCEPQSLPFA